MRRDEMQTFCSGQNWDQMYFLNKLGNTSARCWEPDVKYYLCAYKLKVAKLDFKELPVWNGHCTLLGTHLSCMQNWGGLRWSQRDPNNQHVKQELPDTKLLCGKLLRLNQQEVCGQAEIKILPFRVFIALLYLGSRAQRLPLHPTVFAIHLFYGRKTQTHFRRDKVVEVVTGHIVWDLTSLFHIPTGFE